MWSRNKKDYFLRSSLLIINCATCIAIIFINLKYTGEDNVEFSTQKDFQSEKLTDEKCFLVCDSKACIWRANYFLRMMNLKADPCENYRSFLCGGFERNFGPGEIGDVIEESNKKLMDKVKDFLENIYAEPESASAKMLTVYDSCINYGSSQLRGIQDLTDFLNSLGLTNWPHLAQNFQFNVSLPMIFANFAVYAKGSYIYLNHVGAPNDTDLFEISFEDSSFDSNTIIRQELAVSILEYFGLESEDIDAIIKDHEHVRNSILNSYENLEECYEGCDEDNYIDCSSNNSNWQPICETTEVLLNLMNYKDRVGEYSLSAQNRNGVAIKNLFLLLHSLPGRSVANFLALDFIYRYQDILSLYFRFSKFKNKETFSKLTSSFIDRKRYCVQWIVENLRFPLVNEVLHQYLTTAVMREIVDQYHEYSSTLLEIVALQKWLPPESKSELEEKIKNIEFNMEQMSQILPNVTKVNKVYEKFHPTAESFFNNVLLLKRSVFKPSCSAINPLYMELLDWHMPDFAVYAYSFIALDLGFFYPPFYIPNHIRVFNFAALVDVIGHEFGHNVVRHYEEIEEMPPKFLEAKQCLTDQFSKFRFENLNEYLNGSMYVDENLADSIGTALTDKVIEKYSYSEEITLPGLPFSTKKLLYIISMQFWCSKYDLRADIYFKNEATHAPSSQRLIGKMQNSRDFSETFQCSNKSFMNPWMKCSLLDPNGK